MAEWSEVVSETSEDNYDYWYGYPISGTATTTSDIIYYSDIDDTTASGMPKQVRTQESSLTTRSVMTTGPTGTDPYTIREVYDAYVETDGYTAVRQGTMVDGDGFRVTVYDVYGVHFTSEYHRTDLWYLDYIDLGYDYYIYDTTETGPTEVSRTTFHAAYINIDGTEYSYQDTTNDTEIVINPAMCTANGAKAVIWSVSKPGRGEMEWYLWYGGQLYEGPVYPYVTPGEPIASITDAPDDVVALGDPVTYGLGRMGTIRKTF